jgi:TPR repeat protein
VLKEAFMPLFQALRTAIFLMAALVFWVAQPAAAQNDISTAYNKVKPALALIMNEEEASSGTGFCIYSNGTESYYVTNHHVVGDSNQVIVIRQYPRFERMVGAVIAKTPGSVNDMSTLASGNDLAVVLVNHGGIPALPLSSSNPDEGAVVAVAGYPNAQFTLASLPGYQTTPSVHVGTISALQNNGRDLQYDAQTFHGNSGGPIFDLLGHVVAVVDLGFGGTISSQEVDITNVNLGISAARVLAPFLRSSRIIYYRASPGSNATALVRPGNQESVVAFQRKKRLDAGTRSASIDVKKLDDQADALEDQGKYAEALTLYLKAAEKGDVYGMESVGTYYQNGFVTQDYDKAFKYNSAAAAKGNEFAECNLGVDYDMGWGTERNYSEALRYYRLSADQGDATCQYNLGRMFYMGTGVDQDYTEAIRNFKLAADQGFGSAFGFLAHMYEMGHGVDKDYSIMRRYAEKGVAAGDGYSMVKLGFLYVHGLGGLQPDCGRGRTLYDEAIASGDTDAVQDAKDQIALDEEDGWCR